MTTKLQMVKYEYTDGKVVIFTTTEKDFAVFYRDNPKVDSRLINIDPNTYTPPKDAKMSVWNYESCQ